MTTIKTREITAEARGVKSNIVDVEIYEKVEEFAYLDNITREWVVTFGYKVKRVKRR